MKINARSEKIKLHEIKANSSNVQKGGQVSRKQNFQFSFMQILPISNYTIMEVLDSVSMIRPDHHGAIAVNKT